MTEHLPRTAHVNIHVVKTIEIEEPDWCRGHSEDRAENKVDITHWGPEHSIEIGGFELFKAMLTAAPYSPTLSPDPVLYIEEGDITGSYTPDEVEELADALTAAAGRLRALADELTELLAGGGQ